MILVSKSCNFCYCLCLKRGESINRTIFFIFPPRNKGQGLMDSTWFNQLEPAVKGLLLGSAGNYLGGLAGAATGRIIRFAGVRIVKKFKQEPRVQALNLAMARALHETIDGLTNDQEAYNHLLGMFKEWIDRECLTALPFRNFFFMAPVCPG